MVTKNDVLSRRPVYRDDLLEGRKILVSGGGTGIGQAIALLCGELGASVILCGRRPEPLEETRQLLESGGASCIARPTNIRVPEEVDALFSECGPVDAVVNNAGGQFPSHALEISDGGWNAVIETNLTGSWTMMQRAARQWREANRPGSIVNIIAPYERGLHGVAHTVAARAGVAYLSRNLAIEWAPLDIRVNCVLPGGISTRGLEVYDEAVRNEMADAVPMHRLGEVQDVAEAVVYLIAPSGGFITGETLTVDGGLQIHGELWQAGKPYGWAER
jgi:citronellol/citronellal dehydrogenase